jgi:hypothetical protein
MYQPRSHIHLFTLCLAPAFALSACVGLAGNGHRSTEMRDVGEFTKLQADGPFDVQVNQGDDRSVQVDIDSNLLSKLKTEVSNDTLNISSDGVVYDLVAGPHVIVTVPHLVDVLLIASGNVVAGTFDETDDVHLRDSGSGDLTFDGSSPHLRAEVVGSGDVWLSGSTDTAEYYMRGSGDLDARDLVAGGADVDLDSSGDLRATVNGTIKATLHGSGDIDVFGQAQVDTVTKKGSGDLVVH